LRLVILRRPPVVVTVLLAGLEPNNLDNQLVAGATTDFALLSTGFTALLTGFIPELEEFISIHNLEI
jgi:hypothetical protein